MQRLPGLRTVLESAGLRLLSFCQCFPECFSLRFLPEWGLRVSLAPASSEPALDLPLVENMLEAVIVQHVERYHDKHSANCKAPAAPMGWLVRRTGPELDAYIAHAARRHLHFQLDPEASGFANLRLALRGCVASHVRDFVHARSEVFSWVEGPPCDGGHARELPLPGRGRAHARARRHRDGGPTRAAPGGGGEARGEARGARGAARQGGRRDGGAARRLAGGRRADGGRAARGVHRGRRGRHAAADARPRPQRIALRRGAARRRAPRRAAPPRCCGRCAAGCGCCRRPPPATRPAARRTRRCAHCCPR